MALATTGAFGALLAPGGQLVGATATGTALLRSVILVGHGDGPGIGMGQWGDFGYAVRYHFPYQRILAHYYGATRLTTLGALGRTDEPVLRVVILENLDLSTNVGFDPVVTSPSAFAVSGGSGPPGPPAVVSGTSGTSGTQGTTGTSGTQGTTGTSGTSGTPGTSGTSGGAVDPSGVTATAPVASGTSGRPSGTSATVGLSGPSGPSGPVETATGSSGTIGTSAPTSGPSGATGAPSPSAAAGTAQARSIERAAPTTASGSARRLSVPAGMAVDLRLEPDGTWSAFEGSSCGAAVEAAARGTVPAATGLVDPVVHPPSASPGAPVSKLLTLCRHDKVDETLRGAVEAYDRQGYERTLNLVPLDAYLEGVVPAEVSASWGSDGTATGAPQGRPWGFQALEAQAVAARSYALAMAGAGGWMGYADVCDSIFCQAYVGADYEQAATDAAVAATRGQVLVSGSGPGSLVLARYAASSGGWTAPGSFPAVADLGDACVVPGDPLECNPVHTWRVTRSAATLSRALPGLGGIVSLRVVERDHVGAFGGRALEVAVVGVARREVVSASTFAADLGLYSDWFAVAGATRSVVAPPTTTTVAPTPTTTTTMRAAPTPTTTTSVAPTTTS